MTGNGLRLGCITMLTFGRVSAFVGQKGFKLQSSTSSFKSPTPNLSGRNNQSLKRMVASDTEKNPFSALLDVFQKKSSIFIDTTINSSSGDQGQEVVESFISALNSRGDPSELMRFFDDQIRYEDTAYYSAIEGKDDLIRHFYLNAGSTPMSTFSKDTHTIIVIDDIVASGGQDNSINACTMYHLEENGNRIEGTTAITFFSLQKDEEQTKITQVFDVTEPSSPKPGDSGLKLLKSVSKFIGDESIVVKSDRKNNAGSAVENYFEAWNRRDMKDAISFFAEDCVMSDLQYDGSFDGKEQFERHLLRVKDCLPSSFEFVIDNMASSPEKVGVLWHVENQGEPLAFTRGCSFYKIESNLIKSGFEIPEKAPPKQGILNTIASKFAKDPTRIVPATIWAAYMYILFFSDGILPGANALALEVRTWEEVRDLSLNFFLVSPMLGLDFAPVVHPMLEGVFNLLLAWAAMFAGFLSDERKDKPNLLPFGPMLIGMQFLTSGFLLPYLFTRTPENGETKVFKDDITGSLQATVGEWRPLGLLLGGIGTGSITWAMVARPEFGEFSERYNSFTELLSIDRVGSSFLVDLVIFALFQGWFVDDDLNRRGVNNDEMMILRNTAKFIPFFGLAAYLTLRPSLKSRDDVYEN